jgi:hypothetical protein
VCVGWGEGGGAKIATHNVSFLKTDFLSHYFLEQNLGTNI